MKRRAGPPERTGRRRSDAARTVSPGRRAGDLASLALVAAQACLWWLMVRSGAVAAWLIGGWLLLCGVTALAYARDKRAARQAGPRTPEHVLQWLALAGGWPGALLAQRALRHKTRKRSFQFAFWACVVLHEAALGHWWRWVESQP